jgi:hypothetical protein
MKFVVKIGYKYGHCVGLVSLTALVISNDCLVGYKTVIP